MITSALFKELLHAFLQTNDRELGLGVRTTYYDYDCYLQGGKDLFFVQNADDNSPTLRERHQWDLQRAANNVSR